MIIDDKVIKFVEMLAQDLYDVTGVFLKQNYNDIEIEILFNMIISSYMTGMFFILKKLSRIDERIESGMKLFIHDFQEHLKSFHAFNAMTHINTDDKDKS